MLQDANFIPYNAEPNNFVDAIDNDHEIFTPDLLSE